MEHPLNFLSVREIRKITHKSKGTEPAKSSLSFKFFWPSFDQTDNYFTNCLHEELYSGEIEIHSVFESNLRKLLRRGIAQIFIKSPKRIRNNSRKVWFTGENVRPPFRKGYDATISFDQDSHGGSNTYFPLLYMETLFPNNESVVRRGVRVDAAELLKIREMTYGPKKFACAFINNPDPIRLRAIEELKKHGDVEVFGKYAGRPVVSKYEIAKNFQFSLCFENDLYPGYVTEKLLDAYACETVPLYWGDLGSEKHLNREAFVNAKDFETLNDFAKFISNLSAGGYHKIYSRPLYRTLPSKYTLMHALVGERSGNLLD